jgi:hypothetical protein
MMSKPRPSYQGAVRFRVILTQRIYPLSQLVRCLFVTTFVERIGTLTVLDNCYADLSHERTKEAIERNFAYPQTDNCTQILNRCFDCRISGFHMLASAGIILRA